MQVECPSCGKQFNAPEDQAGQVIKCEACGGEMQLPATVSPPAEAGDAGVQSVASEGAGESKTCPYCGESVLAIAQKCKHCHTFLSGPMAGKSSDGPKGGQDDDAKEGKKALIFGIIGVVFCQIIFGPLAIIYGNKARKAGSTAGTVAMVLGIIDLIIFALAVIIKISAGRGGRF
jgi:predicted RNA-binding Zn-ribbon protein involved in translation (DUF1610 family)